MCAECTAAASNGGAQAGGPPPPACPARQPRARATGKLVCITTPLHTLAYLRLQYTTAPATPLCQRWLAVDGVAWLCSRCATAGGFAVVMRFPSLMGDAVSCGAARDADGVCLARQAGLAELYANRVRPTGAEDEVSHRWVNRPHPWATTSATHLCYLPDRQSVPVLAAGGGR